MRKKTISWIRGMGVWAVVGALAGCLGGADREPAVGPVCGVGTSPSRHAECLVADVVDARLAVLPDAGLSVQVWRLDELVTDFATEVGVDEGSAETAVAERGDLVVLVASDGAVPPQAIADEILRHLP